MTPHHSEESAQQVLYSTAAGRKEESRKGGAALSLYLWFANPGPAVLADVLMWAELAQYLGCLKAGSYGCPQLTQCRYFLATGLYMHQERMLNKKVSIGYILAAPIQ